MSRTLVIWMVAYALVSAGLSAWVYRDSLRDELRQDRAAGAVRLSEAISRLKGQLDVYRTLANTTAEDPRMWAIFDDPPADGLSVELARSNLTYGTWEVDLVDRSGAVVVTSSPRHLGFVYDPALVRPAFNGRLGYALETEGAERLVRFSRGIRRADGAIRGAVVMSANLASLEFEWPVTPEPIVFRAANGLSISSNRPELVAQPITGVSEQQGVQVVERFIPLLEMSAQIILDTSDARAEALLRALLALALLVALGLVAVIFVLQRRRLAAEARQSATLEERVEARTSELRSVQGELVEASNLAALGRLSAGISHELNQPLGAILNFAQNGQRLIARERHAEAGENLNLIAGQVQRITRIIGHLRAFARQDSVATESVDLVEITRSALALAQPDLTSSAIALHTDLPDAPVWVEAGRVRLEQVVLILVSNARDAMRDASDKKLTVSLFATDAARLTITDTGTGITEPDRVFEPFYTTKELGASKGLGMGLALAFGLVTRFGGQLACANTESGAQFTITLPLGDAPDD